MLNKFNTLSSESFLLIITLNFLVNLCFIYLEFHVLFVLDFVKYFKFILISLSFNFVERIIGKLQVIGKHKYRFKS